MKMQQKRYSETFKRHVCEELKAGTWTSTRQAAEAYNIRPDTVRKWMDGFGYHHLRQRTLYVKTPEDSSQIEALKAQVRSLERQLFDAMLEGRVDRAALKVACGLLNTTPDELKKKTTGLK